MLPFIDLTALLLRNKFVSYIFLKELNNLLFNASESFIALSIVKCKIRQWLKRKLHFQSVLENCLSKLSIYENTIELYNTGFEFVIEFM